MEPYRLCRAGDHSQCRPADSTNSSGCNERARLEQLAVECKYARAVLDYCREHDIPWSELGSDLAGVRKKARYPLDKTPWLAAQFPPADELEKNEAAFWYGLR